MSYHEHQWHKINQDKSKIVQGIARVSNKRYHLKHNVTALVCGKGIEDVGRGEINLGRGVHGDSLDYLH